MYAQCFSGNHELIWGLPPVAPLEAKTQFPEKSRKPMIRLYCFPGDSITLYRLVYDSWNYWRITPGRFYHQTSHWWSFCKTLLQPPTHKKNLDSFKGKLQQTTSIDHAFYHQIWGLFCRLSHQPTLGKHMITVKPSQHKCRTVANPEIWDKYK